MAGFEARRSLRGVPMPWPIFQIYGILPAFLLVLFRVAGLVFAVPFLSGSVIPARIKVALTVAVSLAVFPILMPRIPSWNGLYHQLMD